MKSVGYNMIFKMMWIILSLIELYLVNKIIPNKKIKIISNIGANTLNVYLLHSLIVKWLKVYGENMLNNTEIINIIMMLVLTCMLLVILGSEFVKNKMIYFTDLNKVKEKLGL